MKLTHFIFLLGPRWQEYPSHPTLGGNLSLLSPVPLFPLRDSPNISTHLPPNESHINRINRPSKRKSLMQAGSRVVGQPRAHVDVLAVQSLMVNEEGKLFSYLIYIEVDCVLRN